MRVELRAIDSIKPYPANPRRNDGAVAAVANSITAYGFRQPIVVDKAGVIVVGHTRWKAAQQLGMTQVPVHVADLTPEQAKAYRLADNKTNEIAEWDDDLLAGELSELKALGVDLDALGWTPDELGEVLAPDENDGLTPADEVPEPTEGVTTRPGDLWILGQHRLLCGDSTSAADVDRLMNGAKAALVATDPPYLVDYTGSRFIGGVEKGKDWSSTYKEVDVPDADEFFRSVFANIVHVVAPRAAIYCWYAHKRQAMIDRVWEELGILNHQQIIWVKPTPVFGRVYWHFRHEPCMMGWVQGSQPEHDSDHSHNSVWEIDWEGKARIVGNEHPSARGLGSLTALGARLLSLGCFSFLPCGPLRLVCSRTTSSPAGGLWAFSPLATGSPTLAPVASDAGTLVGLAGWAAASAGAAYDRLGARALGSGISATFFIAASRPLSWALLDARHSALALSLIPDLLTLAFFDMDFS